MSDSLEQIVVEYKLDVSTLKQQFEQMKADMQGLKSTAENSSREAGEHIKGHIGKGVDDTRETFKKLGTELKQVFAFTQTNEAVKQLQNLDKAAAKASKEVSSLEKTIIKNQTALNKLGEGATSNSAKIEKLQGQLAAKQAEIGKMAEQGKEHLKMYTKAIEQAAKWQEKLDGFSTNTKKIQENTDNLNKTLQENTDKLNAAKGAAAGLQILNAGSHLVKGLASSFDAANSALHLFAGENEKLQKGLGAVHEVMNIAKAATEAITAVQGVSAAVTAAKTAAVTTETGAQEVNTSTTWLGTAAQEALNLVMEANPIAAVIGLVTGLVAAIAYFISSSDQAAEKQKKLNEEQKNSIEVSKRKLDAAKDESDSTIKTAEIVGKYISENIIGNSPERGHAYMHKPLFFYLFK